MYVLFLGPLITEVVCPGADYYVDAAGGNDRNTGPRHRSAWQIHRQRSTAYTGFAPGDRVLLRRGQVWREHLIVPASGTADKPIVFGAYGAGQPAVAQGLGPWSRTGTDAGRANCWRAPLDVAPNQVFFNGVRGIVQSGPDRLDRPLEWAWSDGVLYV